MPIDSSRTQSLFRRLERLIPKLAKHAQPDHVHHFRTSIRRLETLLEQLVPKPDRSQKKLLKRLSKLRKRAGHIRDLDVQVAALKSLKIDRGSQDKRELVDALGVERQKWEKKLTNALDARSSRELRKRLRRAAQNPELHSHNFDPVSRALGMFSRLSLSEGALSEKVLHAYRLQCKNIRYVAEMAGAQPEAKAVIDQLKKMQDAIGEWHDWDTLTVRASRLLAGSSNPPLVTALRAVAKAQLADALLVSNGAIAALLDLYKASTGRRKPARAAESASERPDLAKAANA